MLKTFRGGVHPKTSKGFTVDKPARKAPIPKKAVIPLLQHTGAPCNAVVSPGDHVDLGQTIGVSDKFISSPVHASLSGTVISIDKRPHPVLGRYDAVLIETDGLDTPAGSLKGIGNAGSMSDDEIRGVIKESGIVGLGGAAFPAHVKLTPPEEKSIDSVILNGAECEPYLTCDHRLMLENPGEIIEGLKIITRLTKASNVYISVESNKIGAAFALEKALRNAQYKMPNTKIVILKTKYPQGAEKQLIKSVLNREVPPQGLPFDIGCVVANVGTTFAIYEAVFKGKPLYERIVTVSGSCIKDPSNLWTRIGTTVNDLVDACGGFKEEPAKVIFGGPMMGLTQQTLETPVIKGTSGIIFLSDKDVTGLAELNCIRCARCVDVCPLNLIPTDIARLVKKGMYKSAGEYNIEDCVECGACSYECPSKIPLLQWIKIGKYELLKLKNK